MARFFGLLNFLFVWSVLFSFAAWIAFHFAWLQVGRWWHVQPVGAFYPDAPDAVIVAGGYGQINFVPDPYQMVTAIFARAARDCEGFNVFRGLVMACGFFLDEIDPALV